MRISCFFSVFLFFRFGRRLGFVTRCEGNLGGCGSQRLPHKKRAQILQSISFSVYSNALSHSFSFPIVLDPIILTKPPAPLLSLASTSGTPSVLQTPTASSSYTPRRRTKLYHQLHRQDQARLHSMVLWFHEYVKISLPLSPVPPLYSCEP